MNAYDRVVPCGRWLAPFADLELPRFATLPCPLGHARGTAAGRVELPLPAEVVDESKCDKEEHSNSNMWAASE